MITRNQFEEIYPLVNEIVVFSNSFDNEDNPLFKYLNTGGEIYGSYDLMKIIRSNILSDLLHCYFALGYQQYYNSDYYSLFDLLQYAFWLEKDHFSYEDFEEYASSQSNALYFHKGFNNAKRDNNFLPFPSLYIRLVEVDQIRGTMYILILKKIVTTLPESPNKGTYSKEELVNDLLSIREPVLVSKGYNNESFQFEDNSKYIVITNEEYENYYLVLTRIFNFAESFDIQSEQNTIICEFLESMGCEISTKRPFNEFMRLFIKIDLFNCYFLVGYQRSYQKDVFLLWEMMLCADLQEVPCSYSDWCAIPKSARNYIEESFEIMKGYANPDQIFNLYKFLYIKDDTRAYEYACLLQQIILLLSNDKYNNIIKYRRDPIIEVLLTNPEALVLSKDDDEGREIIEECNQVEDDCKNLQFEEETYYNNISQNQQNMNLLKNELFNGVSFEILNEEYREGNPDSFTLRLRITNFNDKKKKIGVEMKYISIDYGLKDGSLWNFGHNERYLQDNSFVDVDVSFADIRRVKDGDRIEMVVNEGKFASLRLLREGGQWTIVESIERSTYNRDLKRKIEHFEAIEEQFGITLQNFSIKVEDENSLKFFCEVLALNGEIPENDFTINIAIYDTNNDIVYTDRKSKYAEEFKGFEVLTFDYIKLDITIDEISKIRIYPTR